MTSKIPTSEARDQFSDLLNRAAYGKERIVLTRRGKGLVAMVPLEDLELIEELEDRIDLAEALRALKEVEQEGSLAWEDLKAELGL